MTTRQDATALAAFRDTALCDGRCQGELTLVTDGITGLAIRPDQSAEQTLLLRDGVHVTASCPDDDCHGAYYWRLDTPGTWTSDSDTLAIVRVSDSLEVA